jgi:hypothetical protein
VGGVTAVLSLAFAIQQAIQLVSERQERQRQLAELTSIATQQRNAGDYRASWATFERAIETAEPSGQLAKLTGQLSEQRRQLREAQEDLAMTWLEHLEVKSSEGETFSTAIAPLDPVINRGIASSSGPRKADLLAHSGWANFLKWRDGERRLDPDRQYAEALKADSRNPYANAYRAHWLLWTKREGARQEAGAHFSAALGSGRVNEHVRSIQLSALKNLGSDGEADVLAVVNEMRMKGETIDQQTRSDLFSMYSRACAIRDDREHLARFSASVPIAEQLTTFQALFGPDTVGPTDSRRAAADACLAVLLEDVGRPEQALPVWTALAARFPPNSGDRLGDRAREAVNRLRRKNLR